MKRSVQEVDITVKKLKTKSTIGLATFIVKLAAIFLIKIALSSAFFLSLFYQSALIILNLSIGILSTLPTLLKVFFTIWTIYSVFEYLFSKIHEIKYKKKKMKKLRFSLFCSYWNYYLLVLLISQGIILLISKLLDVNNVALEISRTGQIRILFLCLLLFIFMNIIVIKKKGLEYWYKKHLPLYVYNWLVLFLLRTLFLVLCPSEYTYLLITPSLISLLFPDISSLIKLWLGTIGELLTFVSVAYAMENFDINEFIDWGSDGDEVSSNNPTSPSKTLDSEEISSNNPISPGRDSPPILLDSEEVNYNSSISSLTTLGQNLVNEASKALFNNVIVHIAHSPANAPEMTFDSWVKYVRRDIKVPQDFSLAYRNRQYGPNQKFTDRVNGSLLALFLSPKFIDGWPIRNHHYALIDGWCSSTLQKELYLVKAQDIICTTGLDEYSLVAIFVRVPNLLPQGMSVQLASGSYEHFSYVGDVRFMNYKVTPELTVHFEGINAPYDPSNVMHSNRTIGAHSDSVLIRISRLNLMKLENRVVSDPRNILRTSFRIADLYRI